MCVWSSTTSGTKGAGPAWCTKSNKNVQSSQQSSDRSCFCTNTRTHTRQNKPYRLGVVPARVAGARGRCCPAATVPVAVVFACGVCCCIAKEIHQNKIIDRKTELCHHRPQGKAHSNEYENNTHTRVSIWVSGCVVLEAFETCTFFFALASCK